MWILSAWIMSGRQNARKLSLATAKINPTMIKIKLVSAGNFNIEVVKQLIFLESDGKQICYVGHIAGKKQLQLESHLMIKYHSRRTKARKVLQ